MKSDSERSSEVERLRSLSGRQRFSILLRSGYFLIGSICLVISLIISYGEFFDYSVEFKAGHNSIIEDIFKKNEQYRQMQKITESLSTAKAGLEKVDIQIHELEKRVKYIPEEEQKIVLKSIENLQSIKNNLKIIVDYIANAIRSSGKIEKKSILYNWMIIPPAYALQDFGSSADRQYGYGQSSFKYGQSSFTDDLKPMLMVGIIVSITVFFFICIGIYCLAKDAEKIKFADNMIRTIVGFYTGIVTGLLGLPSK